MLKSLKNVESLENLEIHRLGCVVYARERWVNIGARTVLFRESLVSSMYLAKSKGTFSSTFPYFKIGNTNSKKFLDPSYPSSKQSVRDAAFFAHHSIGALVMLYGDNLASHVESNAHIWNLSKVWPSKMPQFCWIVNLIPKRKVN